MGRAVDRMALLLAAGAVAAAGILISGAIRRCVFGAPTIRARETAVPLCALVFLFGGDLCVSQGRRIRATILHKGPPGPAQRARDVFVFVAVASAAAACIFARAACRVVERAVLTPGGDVRPERSGGASTPAIPAGPKNLPFAALALLTAQLLRPSPRGPRHRSHGGDPRRQPHLNVRLRLRPGAEGRADGGDARPLRRRDGPVRGDAPPGRRGRGGVAVQTIFVSAILAAMSGIIGAEIVPRGRLAPPQMPGRGHERRRAIGAVCAGGGLGAMIPPSIMLIIYGLAANVAVGGLFPASFPPG